MVYMYNDINMHIWIYNIMFICLFPYIQAIIIDKSNTVSMSD